MKPRPPITGILDTRMAQGWHRHGARLLRAGELPAPPVEPPPEPRPANPDADPFDLGITPLRRTVVARYLACAADGGVIPWRLLTRAEVEAATRHPDARVCTRAKRQLNRIDWRK